MNTSSIALSVTLVALLSGCAGVHGSTARGSTGQGSTARGSTGQGSTAPGLVMPGAAPQPDSEVVATWYNPPSEFPGICMTQLKNGSLRFDGGFAFFNPGKWSYDPASAELRLDLQPWPSLASAHANKALHKHLLRVEADQNALVYGVRADTNTIGVGGFVFYRDLPCPPSAG